jgi:hypothetical protein
MEPEEIAEKVITILEANPEQISTFYTTSDKIKSTKTMTGFSNEYVELLLQLESKIHTPTEKDFFWQLLGFNFVSPVPRIISDALPRKRITRKALTQVRKHCDCVFMTYLRSGRVNEAMQGFSERLEKYSSVNEVSNQILFCMFQVLLMEPHLFSDENLKTIESIMTKYESCINEASSWHEKKVRKKQVASEQVSDPLTEFLLSTTISTSKEQIPIYLPSTSLISKSKDLLSKLQETLKKVKFERLKEELKGVSTEINQDKNQLVRRYKDLKFNTQLTKALEDIDKEIEETGTKFSYSNSIGFVRKVYEESLRQIAIRIHDITGKSIPKWTGKGKMGEAVDYFRKIDFISEKEKNMLTGFSGFLSDTGSHSLTSEKYEVRIAKNILIEICSYLTDKLDEFI